MNSWNVDDAGVAARAASEARQISPGEQKRNLADLILEQRDKLTEARQIIADLIEYAGQNDPGCPHIGKARGGFEWGAIMKVEHKGYEIDVNREKCMGGWGMLYYSVFTLDGHECLTDFEDSAETVRDKISQLKELVDEELKSGDPFGLAEEVEHGD